MVPVGIDISKSFFDAHLDGRNRRFTYDCQGIEKFKGLLSTDSYCVMESTGSYCYRLAEALAFSGVKVSVVNALSIKRFSQMFLSRTKTDAGDAKLITEYAKSVTLRPFVPLDDAKNRIKQRITAMEGLKGLRKSNMDLIESLKHLPRQCDDALDALRKNLKQIEKNIAVLRKKNEAEMVVAYGRLPENLSSIPGIGMETISLLLGLTDGLKNFDSSRQLAAYAGICPGTKESGTSLKGRGTISRIGHSVLRAKLYMCALTAARKNRACQNLYERLCAKGKSKKVAMVAVAHKLLKQIFAIAKNGTVYEENFGLTA